MLIFVNIKI